MKLLLVRHGKAGKADPKAYPDDDLRPLTPKGEKAFARAAKGLRKLAVKPGKILMSPAERTRRTAEILAQVLKVPDTALAAVPELHHGVSPAKALAKLSRMRLPGTVALVGHEPWLGGFLSLLVSGDGRTGVELDKGGACLVETDALGKGEGKLRWLLTQDQLDGLA